MIYLNSTATQMLVAFNNMHMLRQVTLGLEEDLNLKLWSVGNEVSYYLATVI